MPGATCPYLGLGNDSETALAYASPWNYCYRFDVPAQIALDHQNKYCLALSYVECPIYHGEKNDVFQESVPPIILDAFDASPADNLGEVFLKDDLPESSGESFGEEGLSSRSRMVIPLGIAFLALIVIWGIILGKTVWKDDINSEWISGLISRESMGAATITSTVMGSSKTPIAKPTGPNIILSTVLETSLSETPSPSPSNTNTVSPTVSPSSSVVKAANTSTPYPSTVACGAPYGWVLYRVNVGDTLYSLSTTYGVSISQLQTANCMGSSQELYTGTLIYVPFVIAVPTSTPSKTNTSAPTKVPTNTKTNLPTSTSTHVPTTAIPSTLTTQPATATLQPTVENTVGPTNTLEVLDTEMPVGG